MERDPKIIFIWVGSNHLLDTQITLLVEVCTLRVVSSYEKESITPFDRVGKDLILSTPVSHKLDHEFAEIVCCLVMQKCHLTRPSKWYLCRQSHKSLFTVHYKVTPNISRKCFPCQNNNPGLIFCLKGTMHIQIIYNYRKFFSFLTSKAKILCNNNNLYNFYSEICCFCTPNRLWSSGLFFCLSLHVHNSKTIDSGTYFQTM